MKENNELRIEKIKDKVDSLDIKGQGCWDDCQIWKNNTTTPKCEFDKTAYNNWFSLDLD